MATGTDGRTDGDDGGATGDIYSSEASNATDIGTKILMSVEIYYGEACVDTRSKIRPANDFYGYFVFILARLHPPNSTLKTKCLDS